MLLRGIPCQSPSLAAGGAPHLGAALQSLYWLTQMRVLDNRSHQISQGVSSSSILTFPVTLSVEVLLQTVALGTFPVCLGETSNEWMRSLWGLYEAQVRVVWGPGKYFEWWHREWPGGFILCGTDTCGRGTLLWMVICLHILYTRTLGETALRWPYISVAWMSLSMAMAITPVAESRQ